MTLQQPLNMRISKPILCHKCGTQITFSKDKVGPSGRKIPLEPNSNNAPHIKYCMYASSKDDPSVEALMFNFLSLVPNRRQKRVIGAVGKAREVRE